jgi:hypothetical protein
VNGDPYTDVFISPRTHVGAFVLGGAGTGVEAFVLGEYFGQLQHAGGGAQVGSVGILDSSIVKPEIGTPTWTTFDGDWLTNLDSGFVSSSRPRVGPLYTSYDLYGALPSELVLKQADYYRMITPHQTPRFDSTLPFFYRDSAREYLVVPTIYYQNGNYFTINAPMYVYDPFYWAEYTFYPFYHPFAWLLVAQLNIGGVDALQPKPAARPGWCCRSDTVRVRGLLSADRHRPDELPEGADRLRPQRRICALQLGAVLPRPVPGRQRAAH